MKITTFFIDRFKEVSIPTPSGIQEEGGVYGDETNYSSWILGTDGDTSDFEGIVRTNILFGELYKITLDTGDMFNPQIQGGTPNINGFMNMDIQDYWNYIVNDRFIFNGKSYEQFRLSKGLTAGYGGLGIGGVPGGGTGGRRGGQGGPGGPGGPVGDYPTLLEYASGVKERVGWVEVNRTRASIYYEACNIDNVGGKRARSDHFYDINKFIMTSELFNIDDTQNISTFLYGNINPYTGENERFYTLNQYNVTISPGLGVSKSKLGLIPYDNWFTWKNNAQGHFRNYNNVPGNIGGYLDTFPWPRGPMWGDYSGLPKQYLSSLVAGRQTVLDANINDGGYVVEIPKPSGLGEMVTAVPMLIAQKQKHLNTLRSDRLTRIPESSIPIANVYSADIWGEKRIPELVNEIQLGMTSVLQNPSIGTCQPVNGLGVTTSKDDFTINDPFGLDVYQLDKQYKEIYNLFKFCPPRKKIKYDTNIKPTDVKTPNQGLSVKVTTGNTEEYTLPNGLNLMKIGVFEPDQELLFDTKAASLFEDIKPTLSNNPDLGIDVKLNFYDLDANFIYATENATNGEEFIKDGQSDTLLFTEYSASKTSFFDAPDDSEEKNTYRHTLRTIFNNELEIQSGVRNPNDFIITTPEIPYGTYSHVIENIQLPNGQLKTNIKILQNGGDADPAEFKNAISSIVNKAGNNTNSPKPIGVSENGFPIFGKNTVQESISSITEQFTGVKEIIFRGSDVLTGRVSVSSWTQLNPDNPNENPNILPDKIQYANTGISVNGSIDLNAGEQYDVQSVYVHKIFEYLNQTYREMTSDWFKNPKKMSGDLGLKAYKYSTIERGAIDFIGNYDSWQPYATVRNQNAKPTLDYVSEIILSKYDALGNKRENWPTNNENPKPTPIKGTNKGTIFLQNRTPNLSSKVHSFYINGNITENNNFYVIPVKYASDSFEVPGDDILSPEFESGKFPIYSAMTLKYSEKQTNQSPSEQKQITSVKNTYGGWVFSGLWHRSGAWPKDHKFRSGLLGSVNWVPCDGSVETGAWIKVPSERVRLEYHDFISHSRNTVYSFFHSQWLKIKTAIWEETNPGVPSPYTEDSIQFGTDSPWNSSYQPGESDKEDWEKLLYSQRKQALEYLRGIEDRALIIRLRNNKADPYRGLKEMTFPTVNYWNDTERLKFYKDGSLLEEWVVADKITDDDSIMDSRSNYHLRWYPEPDEHTRGEFKSDEWYRAVFLRAVTSPSNPNGQISSSEINTNLSCRERYVKGDDGKYVANENNKKTFCDLLYVSEQILKMHRARLVEIKKYVDAKTKDAEQSDSDFVKQSFFRSKVYVQTLRTLIKFFK